MGSACRPSRGAAPAPAPAPSPLAAVAAAAARGGLVARGAYFELCRALARALGEPTPPRRLVLGSWEAEAGGAAAVPVRRVEGLLARAAERVAEGRAGAGAGAADVARELAGARADLAAALLGPGGAPRRADEVPRGCVRARPRPPPAPPFRHASAAEVGGCGI